MADDKQLIHQGNLIALHKERVEFPNGGHTHFDIVSHPGGAVVAAINELDEVCLIKQWRHAVGQTIWELPAGCLEINEPALATAKRELEEETGVIATDWQDLGSVLVSPGFSKEELYFFCARGLSKGTINLDDAEEIEVHWIPLTQAYDMAKSGEICDAKTIALLFRLSLNKS